MSISSVGSMSLNAINTNIYSAPIQSKPAVSATETTTPVIADSIETASAPEVSTPDFSQLMKAVQSDSTESAPQVEAQPSLVDNAEVAKADHGLEMPGPDASPEEVAAYCVDIARSDADIEARTELISQALSQGIEKADSPNAEWTKATPEQIKLYVQETLEHVDAVRQIGELRGMDFNDHDLEVGTGKFEPKIAQFLALPGREDSVKWSIAEHNASPHHDTWKDPNASVDDLAESASDIVNAWRMNRRVYDKPSWSWERIADFVDAQYQNNQLSANQREAIFQAIPFQMEWENKFGIPA